MLRHIALGITLALSLAAAPATTAPTTQPRLLYFDTIVGGPNVPDGFKPAIVDAGGRYTNAIGREGSYYIGGYRGPTQDLDLVKTRFAGSRVPAGTLYVIDNETDGWATDVRRIKPAAAKVAIDRYVAWSTAMRADNPTIRLAIYDVLPRFEAYCTTYHYFAVRAVEKAKRGETLDAHELWFASHAFSFTPAGWVRDDNVRSLFSSYEYFQWRKSNDADVAAGLLECVDVVTPSIYFYGLGEGVEGYTAEMLAEARRVSPGKPICPVIWPRYHDDESKQPTLDVWRAFCRQIFEGADGAVLWGVNLAKDKAYVDIAREEAERANAR